MRRPLLIRARGPSAGYESRLPKRDKRRAAADDADDLPAAGEYGGEYGGEEGAAGLDEAAAAAVPVKRKKNPKWKPQEDAILREQYEVGDGRAR